jgi:hypothetical protein
MKTISLACLQKNKVHWLASIFDLNFATCKEYLVFHMLGQICKPSFFNQEDEKESSFIADVAAFLTEWLLIFAIHSRILKQGKFLLKIYTKAIKNKRTQWRVMSSLFFWGYPHGTQVTKIK